MINVNVTPCVSVVLSVFSERRLRNSKAMEITLRIRNDAIAAVQLVLGPT